MIAHVIPLARLPAHISFFDYHINKESRISIGDLVSCSLRGKIVQGIVFAISEDTKQKRVLDISDVLMHEFLSSKNLAFYTRLAKLLGQSIASCLQAAIPSYPLKHLSPQSTNILDAKKITNAPYSLQKNEVPILQGIMQRVQSSKKYPLALQGDEEVSLALLRVLAERLPAGEQMLILVPYDRDATLVARLLAKQEPAIVTGKTSLSNRQRFFAHWHSGNLPILIATKQGALWPPKKLHTVFVFHAGNSEYAHARRNPKIDPREVGKLLAKTYNAAYISIDTLPRIEDAAEGVWEASYIPEIMGAILPSPLCIGLRDQREKTPFPLMSHSLIEAIAQTSQKGKKVLLFLNRTGAAKRLVCKACDHVPLCGTCGSIPTIREKDLICTSCGTEMWLPHMCPHCSTPSLIMQGVGGAKITHDIQQLFPKLHVVEVNKMHQDGWQEADVLITTEHFFANLFTPFTRYGFGLIADLLADLGLQGNDFRANESVSRHLLRLVFLAKREHAQCIFQTWLPERLPDLFNAKFVITEELSIRKKYQLPPFGTIYHTKTTVLRNPIPTPQEPFLYDGPYVSPQSTP